jgi:hypothetical protein
MRSSKNLIIPLKIVFIYIKLIENFCKQLNNNDDTNTLIIHLVLF